MDIYNSVITVLNLFIITVFLILLFVGYRLVGLMGLLSKSVEDEPTGQNDSDEYFEPFFDTMTGNSQDYYKEQYKGKIFEEYDKIYSKEETKQSVENLQSKSEAFPECYKILGFKRKPQSMQEIKTKYRELSKKLHPDRGGSEKLFIKINEAYGEAKEIWKP